jgi:hypothetical protein
VNKYKSKPDVMLADLQKKYSELYHFPAQVLLADVQRVEQQCALPPCLLALLPPRSPPLPPYDARMDPRATAFDPQEALRASHCGGGGALLPCSPVPGAPPVPRRDNLSKVASLLPGAEKEPLPPSATSRGGGGGGEGRGGSSSSSRVSDREQGQDRELGVRPLDRIALASSKHRVQPRSSSGAGAGGGGLEDSPLAMLFAAMQQRRRVRVIIRRVNRRVAR